MLSNWISWQRYGAFVGVIDYAIKKTEQSAESSKVRSSTINIDRNSGAAAYRT
jgi:hypothetical protein